jgi:two-component system, sensor histidine kinase and response regulator
VETLRVLITDDELGMRLGVSRTLRGFTVRVPDINGEVGFSVEQAESGEQALEIIRREPPDILLLDHKMPGISGLDVLDQIAGLETDMLAIMITAYASIETAVTATKRGAYDFLAKPFTPDELKAAIRKAAHRILLAKQARKLAEEKRQVRFQFIRVLGHELKAPLSAVEGYLHMLQDHSLGENLGAYGEVLQRSVTRLDGMRKLIADLLDLTHIESGARQRDLRELDLCDVARAAMETAQSDAQARDVTIELHAAAPVRMTADRSEIEMILNNLVSNAIKYNRPGGRVDVTLSQDAGKTTIAVADTGIGMTEEEAGKLFGEFVRIRNEKTSNILGSGLGLSIVKKLALLYGGEATVQSQPDAGSTFTVTLGESTGTAASGTTVSPGGAN